MVLAACLWASQVAAGEENALRLRVYGTHAGLSFDQQNPNELWLTPLGGAAQRITRGRVQCPEALHATRVPAGTPRAIWKHSRSFTPTRSADRGLDERHRAPR